MFKIKFIRKKPQWVPGLEGIVSCGDRFTCPGEHPNVIYTIDKTTKGSGIMISWGKPTYGYSDTYTSSEIIRHLKDGSWKIYKDVQD